MTERETHLRLVSSNDSPEWAPGFDRSAVIDGIADRLLSGRDVDAMDLEAFYALPEKEQRAILERGERR